MLKIGYARCSTTKQDLRAQKQMLQDLGVDPDRIYTDFGLTGRNKDRPGLEKAIAACRDGDTFCVTKLDRLARSVPDARNIASQLQANNIKLQLGSMIYDPEDPMGKMFFNILASFAEFEADIISQRTKEGMAIAKAKGRLKGKPPKLNARQHQELYKMHATGDYSVSELSQIFGVSRPSIYRAIARQGAKEA